MKKTFATVLAVIALAGITAAPADAVARTSYGIQAADITGR